MSKTKTKKTNTNIYHFENYIQMQKLNCILNIFSTIINEPPRPKKSRHPIQSKRNGALEFAFRPVYSLCSHIERVRELMFKIHVQCSNQR